MKKEIRTFKLTMSKEKRDLIQQGIDKCKLWCKQREGQDISDSRALELIILEYLSGYEK